MLNVGIFYQIYVINTIHSFKHLKNKTKVDVTGTICKSHNILTNAYKFQVAVFNHHSFIDFICSFTGPGDSNKRASSLYRY